jgi:hypothetical protein
VILLTGTAVSLDVLFNETGGNKLILADTNGEGANMLALQTRQQLGVTSLSLASQAAQSVLRLFGKRTGRRPSRSMKVAISSPSSPALLPKGEGASRSADADIHGTKRYFPSSFFFEGR